MPAPSLARTLDSLAERIERSSSLDGPAEVLGKLGGLLERPALRRVLSGTDTGHPAHPPMVTVPIGAWMTTALLDLTGQERAAQAAVGFGVGVAVPAAAAGLSDWLYTDGGERRLGLVHALTNVAATGSYAASWIARRRGSRAAGVTLSGLGATLALAGGWLGGHLAYARGVGVDTTAFQHSPEEWTDAADASDAPQPGNLGQGSAGGTPVVLAEQDGELHALADRCTHRGGPLHEGELRDGCVTCPWHGSEFSLADGSVREGPAVRPQPVFDVRTEGGKIQVRRDDPELSLRHNPVGA